MSLNIKNPETHRLVRELAKAMGLSQTAAVTLAVSAQLEQIRAGQDDRRLDVERGLALLREMRGRFEPGYLDQDFDAILYDDRGLPS